MKKHFLISTTLSSLFIFLVCLATPTQAKVGLAVDPAIVRIQVKPGKSITKAFDIYNTEDVDKDIVLRLIPFNKSDRYGNPIIDIKNTAEWSKYFNLSNTNIKLNEPFVVKAKSKQQVILSISIPETANIEDLYLTLLFSTYNNNLETEQKGSLLSATIGANILISVTSELNPKTILKIDNINLISGSYLKIGKRYLTDNLTPIEFESSVTNAGNHITETKGTVKISKRNGETVSIEGILPQYVLSKNSRKILSNKGENFHFQPNFNNFGPYLITVDIKSDNTNTSNSIEIFFFPFKSTLGIIISLIILKTILGFRPKRIDN